MFGFFGWFFGGMGGWRELLDRTEKGFLQLRAQAIREMMREA